MTAKTLWVTTGLMVAMASLGAGTRQATPDALLERAKALHRQVPLIDGHNDFPWALRETSPARDLERARHLTVSQPSIMTDIPRLRAGGVGGQFWSVYVPVDHAGRRGGHGRRSSRSTSSIAWSRSIPDTFELALTADDVERAFKAGKIASLIGMEGGHSINNSLATLRQIYALGARYMTLTHTRNTDWADSATDAPAHHGLTPFGEEVVHEMNRLGMLVDLSHVSPETMAAALRVTQGAGDLLALVGARDLRPPAQRARRHPAAGRGKRRRRDGELLPDFLVPEGGKQATELYALQRTSWRTRTRAT